MGRTLRGDGSAGLDLAARVETRAAAGRQNRLLAAVQLVRGISGLASGSYGEAYQEPRRMFDQEDPSFALGGTFVAVSQFAEAATRADRPARRGPCWRG